MLVSSAVIAGIIALGGGYYLEADHQSSQSRVSETQSVVSKTKAKKTRHLQQSRRSNRQLLNRRQLKHRQFPQLQLMSHNPKLVQRLVRVVRQLLQLARRDIQIPLQLVKQLPGSLHPRPHHQLAASRRPIHSS
ncbi:hypothetical protein MAA39_00785 [Lactiplantibacillus plantarum]|nr:hypothetical protein [Lactiplantibacillus plantarum]